MKTPRVLLAAALLALCAACSADVTAPDAEALHPAGPSLNAGHPSNPGPPTEHGQGQGQGTGGTTPTTTAAGAEIEMVGEGGYLGSGGGR